MKSEINPERLGQDPEPRGHERYPQRDREVRGWYYYRHGHLPPPHKVLEQPGPDTDGWAAVSITVGKQTDLYLLHMIPCEFGNGAIGFEVEKRDADFATVETYHVCLNGPESNCDCKGHSRHGHFKHREGVAKLLELGKLPAYRSSGDMARNDPESFAQHEASIAGVFTPREKDRHGGPDDTA